MPMGKSEGKTGTGAAPAATEVTGSFTFACWIGIGAQRRFSPGTPENRPVKARIDRSQDWPALVLEDQHMGEIRFSLGQILVDELRRTDTEGRFQAVNGEPGQYPTLSFAQADLIAAIKVIAPEFKI